jgi:hypothetical protein
MGKKNEKRSKWMDKLEGQERKEGENKSVHALKSH